MYFDVYLIQFFTYEVALGPNYTGIDNMSVQVLTGIDNMSVQVLTICQPNT